MLTRLIALIVFLLALAAGFFLVATGGQPELASPKPIYMYGGERTETGISTEALAAIDASQDSRIHLVVQFERVLTRMEEDYLESRFYIDILETVPVDAYVISFPVKRVHGILNELRRVTPARKAVVNIRPSDKLSPALGEPGNIVIPEYAIQQDAAAVILHFFSDTAVHDFANIFEGISASLFGNSRVRPRLDGSFAIVIDTVQIEVLLKNDQLRWIEPIPPDAVDDLGLQSPPLPGWPSSVQRPIHGVGAREVAGHTGPPGGGAGTLIAQWESCPPRADHPGLTDFPGPLSQFAPPFQARVVSRIENGNSNPVPGDCKPSLFSASEQSPPAAWHATMVAGIMMGAPVEGPFKDFYGMATKARIRGYSLEEWRTDLKVNYADAMAAGAIISQNSWGDGCAIYTNLAPSFYRWQSGLYDSVVSGRDDQGAAIADFTPMLIVTSAGNHGDEEKIPALWGSARVANSAKNILTIGNVNTQPLLTVDKWAHVSSGRGPTGDGRLAPVLSAPGIRLKLDASNNPIPSTCNNLPGNNSTPSTCDDTPKHGGIRSTYPKDTYKSTWGTSFSAPIVSGAAARLTETYRNTCPADPTPAALRALLVHTAHDLTEAYSTLGDVQGNDLYLYDDQCSFSTARSGYFLKGLNPGSEFLVQQGPVYKGPDYIYGYGMVQADKASSFAESSHFLEDELIRGYKEYRVNVDASMLTEDNGELRVTLAWDDPPWPVNSFPDPEHGLLQNDLDLELIDPTSRRHLPWVLNPAEPSEPAEQSSKLLFMPVPKSLRDQRNTIEQISIVSPQTGVWRIRVRASHMVRPPQSFTLVSSVIKPATDCSGLPSRTVEHPVELPSNWLFWLAVLMLVLLFIALIWLIWNDHRGQTNTQLPWIGIILAFLALLVLVWLIFMEMVLA